MKKLTFVISVLFLVFGLVMTTLITGLASKEDNSVVFGLTAEPPVLDPHYTSSGVARSTYSNMYDSLVMHDDSGEYVGALAENWTISEDRTEYIFRLRKGVKFHNGEELKASDVKFSLDRGKNSPHVAFMYTGFKDVEVLDDYTVKIQLEAPSEIFLEVMCQPHTSIVSEKAVTELGNQAFARNPVGTGPYKFVKWTPGVSIEMEAFEDYFLGAPSIKYAKFPIIIDRTVATVALEKGEIDIYQDFLPIDKALIMGNPDLTWDQTTGAHVDQFIINCENKILSNRLVRQAIAYAIDKESVLLIGKEGFGVLADSQIPPYLTDYFPETVKAYPYDVEKAKELLKQAGYPDGFSIKMYIIAGYYEKMAQVAQSNLSQVGIDVEIQVFEWGTYLELIGNGNYEMALMGQSIQILDPGLLLNWLFLSGNIGPGGNFCRYQNPEMDKLITTSFSEKDKSKRKEMFKEIVQIAHDDVVGVPVYWWINNIGYNKDLKGAKALTIFHYKLKEYSW